MNTIKKGPVTTGPFLMGISWYEWPRPDPCVQQE